MSLTQAESRRLVDMVKLSKAFELRVFLTFQRAAVTKEETMSFLLLQFASSSPSV